MLIEFLVMVIWPYLLLLALGTFIPGQHCVEPCSLIGDVWTGIFSFSWEPVRNAESQVPPQTYLNVSILTRSLGVSSALCSLISACAESVGSGRDLKLEKGNLCGSGETLKAQESSGREKRRLIPSWYLVVNWLLW